MRRPVTVLIALAVFSLAGSAPAQDASRRMETIKPLFVPVPELLRLMGAHGENGRFVMDWVGAAGGPSRVEIRTHESANLLVVAGDPGDVASVLDLARTLDAAPRQIEIQVRIVEINRTDASDLGIDWEGLWSSSAIRGTATYNELRPANGEKSIQRAVSAQATTDRINQHIHLLEESGAGRVRHTPRILTLNNRPATILDGQRVTYVTRYSSYSNLYETETMDAGLKLNVLPTLGENGTLTLSINAELTVLSGDISGSPVKTGQIIENVVVLRDGESLLLGGFQRHEETEYRKRFPILGHLLPFLFSREVKSERTIDSFVVLEARVVDFSTALDEETREAIDEK